WPELLTLMELGSATQLTLLSAVGGPSHVAAEPERALRVLLHKSHGLLKPEVAQAVIASAQRSIGLVPIAAEVQLLQELSMRALTTLSAYHKAVRRLRALSKHDSAAVAMAK